MWNDKLARARSVPVRPQGLRLAFGWHGGIWTTFAVLMFGLSALALAGLASTRSGVFTVAVLVTALAGCACLYAGRILFLAPATPDRAIRNFFEFVSRGSFAAAWDMLVPTEHEPGLGAFPNAATFRDYWREVRRIHQLRSGKLFFEEMSVETLAPDLAMCRFLLHAAPQILFIPFAGGIDTVALGVGQNLYIQKLLVRRGPDWLVWSPLKFADDEADLRWLATGASV